MNDVGIPKLRTNARNASFLLPEEEAIAQVLLLHLLVSHDGLIVDDETRFFFFFPRVLLLLGDDRFCCWSAASFSTPVRRRRRCFVMLQESIVVVVANVYNLFDLLLAYFLETLQLVRLAAFAAVRVHNDVVIAVRLSLDGFLVSLSRR